LPFGNYCFQAGYLRLKAYTSPTCPSSFLREITDILCGAITIRDVAVLGDFSFAAIFKMDFSEGFF
jgi:hypothetical protein